MRLESAMFGILSILVQPGRCGSQFLDELVGTGVKFLFRRHPEIRNRVFAAAA